MRAAWAICKRELHSYFVSPVAYALMTLFWLAEGSFFISILNYGAYRGHQADVLIEKYGPDEFSVNVPALIADNFLQVTAWLLLFIVPIIAMALLAGERRRGTMELLLTAPVTNAGIMWGKFLGAFIFLVMLLVPTFAFQGFLVAYGSNDFAPWLTGYLGLLLLSAAMLAGAMFVSAITESQVVAAFCGYGLLIIFWFMDALGNLLPHVWQETVRWLSLYDHFTDFRLGVISLRDINYYFCFTLVFMFLTHMILESIRWRGVRSP